MASAAAAASGLLASTRRSIDALLGDVGGLLADLTSQGQPPDAAEEDTAEEENEHARRVIDVELQRFWQSYYELKRRHDENKLSVAVLALTKSGKSTLLNSLMGMEVLPMNNVPETARICRIVHEPSATEPILREGDGAPGSHPSPGTSASSSSSSPGRVTARGEAAIRARLQELNSAARTNRSGSGVLLSPQSSGPLGAAAFGSDVGGAACGSPGGGAGGGGAGGAPAASAVLHISAPLVSLEGFGPEFGRVTLLDTPGPNEAGEEQLKYQVERLLEGVDCVLYLLDYTKLKTAEEEGLFRRLRAINPQLVARLSSRLFFIINKVDASETSEGLDPDEVRTYVADLVTRQLGGGVGVAAAADTHAGSLPGSPTSSRDLDSPGGPGGSGGRSSPSRQQSQSPQPHRPPFRLHPDQVLLLSARNALLARLVLGGRAGPEVLRRFQRLAFGAFGGGMMGRGGPSAEQLRSAAGCLLEGSGILDLEGRVLAFLAAHAGSVKLLATADDTARLLAQVRNVALACRSCLHRNVSVLQAQTEDLRGQLAAAQAAFEDVRARTDAVTSEVVAEIRSHLATLRSRLFTHIVQTLDTDPRAPPPNTDAAAAEAAAGPSSSAAAGASAAPASAAGWALARWARVREKFLSMFTATSSGGGGLPPGAGPSLVPEARSRSREELQALLLELHDDLMGQIHSEVYDFWGVLEACAASRHAELLGALNAHLAALGQRVEGAVSEALGVSLAPADIRLRPPSAEQLHSDVQELIENGIRESSELHIRVGTRTVGTERVRREVRGGHPSLCRWGGYWVEVPKTRTVVERYTATVYSLRPEEIANHFIALVDGAVTASERALSSYVGAMVERQLGAARERLREYSDRYLSAMTAALAASSRGAECRAAALAAVEGYLGRLEELATRAAAAQTEAEGAVPGGAAGLMDEVEVFDDDEGEGEGLQEGFVQEGGDGRGEHGEELQEVEQLPGAQAGERQGMAEGEVQGEADQGEQRAVPAGPAEHEVVVQPPGVPAAAPSSGPGEIFSYMLLGSGSGSRSTLTGSFHGSGGDGGDATTVADGPAAATSTFATAAASAATDAAAAAAVADSQSRCGATTPRTASWSTAPDIDEVCPLAQGEEVGAPLGGEESQRRQPYASAAAGTAIGERQTHVDRLTPAAADPKGTSSEAPAGTVTEAATGSDGGEAGLVVEQAAPPLQHQAGAAVEDTWRQEAHVQQQQQEGGEKEPRPQQLQEGEAQACGAVAPTAPTAPTRHSTSSGATGSSSGMAAFAAPFDYGRAFLHAMTASQMASTAAGREGELEGTLTMIPLHAEGDGEGDGGGAQPRPRRVRSGSSNSSNGDGGRGADSPTGRHGLGSPRSGASEDWQLVGEDEVEGAAGADESKGTGEAK